MQILVFYNGLCPFVGFGADFFITFKITFPMFVSLRKGERTVHKTRTFVFNARTLFKNCL